MSRRDTLPHFSTDHRCGFEARPLGHVDSADEAWQWLPPEGRGWVVLESEVKTYNGAVRPTGPLVHAEMVRDERTVLIRLQDGRWYGWELLETPGESHCWVDSLLVQVASSAESALRYRTYWTRVEDDGVAVWTPVAARLVEEKG